MKIEMIYLGDSYSWEPIRKIHGSIIGVDNFKNGESLLTKIKESPHFKVVGKKDEEPNIEFSMMDDQKLPEWITTPSESLERLKLVLIVLFKGQDKFSMILDL